MLPAANRLRTAADFSRATRRGARSARGCIVAYVSSEDSVSQPRVGLIVSKAVGGSVQRHRAARRLRGAIRPLLPTLPAGSVVVLRALPGADTDTRLGDSVLRAVRSALAARQ